MPKINIKKAKIIALLSYFLIAVFLASLKLEIRKTIAAATIDLSAYIVDSRDQELGDRDLEITFSLYTSAEGDDSRVWQETKTVPVKNGIVKTQLGDQTPFPEYMDLSNNQYYLGIKIGNNSEGKPRRRVTVSPLTLNALNAVNALSAKSADDSKALTGAVIGTSTGNIPVLGSGGKLNEDMLPEVTMAGTISSGAWEADIIANNYIAKALTGKTYNGLSITSVGSGFAITGGSNSLTVSAADIVLDQNLSLSSSPAFSGLSINPSAAGIGGEIRLREATANGTNYVALRAPVSIGDNIVWILPSSDGSTGQVLSTNGTGTLNWANTAGGHDSVTISAPANGLSINGNQVLSLVLSSSTTTGALSSSDWSTFNSKQAAGNYITTLTGEVTASGPGSVSATISNVAVIGKLLTGFVQSSGTVTASDTILSAIEKIAGNTGGGGVTSVGLFLPTEFTISNSPVTGSGTLTGAWAFQTANLVFAAPNGSSGTPTFRALVEGDIPSTIARDAELHNAVTLDTATHDYLTLSTQQIVLGAIDISDDTNLGIGGTILQLSGDSFSLREGAMSTGKLCVFNASGQLECNTDSGTVGHSSVTLTGQNYLTINGSQQVTVGQINIGSTHVTGVLAISNGGIGLSTTNPANGTLLIGNGSGYSLSTLTAGTGVTISSTSGAITINAIGSDSLPSGTQNGQTLRYNGSAWVADGNLFNDGTNIGIGTTNPTQMLAVNGNIGIKDSGYLNFGSTDGTGGYGIRDNGGTLEYKNSAGTWTAFPTSSNQTYSNSGTVAPGAYLDVVHNQNTTDVIADAWVSNGTVWQNAGTLSSTNDNVTNDDLEMSNGTEGNYDMGSQAYSTGVTPSATTGSITLTLASGNWNDNAEVKKGMTVRGNGGEAVITADPAAQSTITAEVATTFTNTNEIASGSWTLTGQNMRISNTLEQMTVSDFKANYDLGREKIKTGVKVYDSGNYEYVSAAQISTNKVLVVYSEGNIGKAVVATISGSTVSYGAPIALGVTSNISYQYLSVAPLGTDKAIVAYQYYSSGYEGRANVVTVSGSTITVGATANFGAANASYQWAYISTAQLGTDKAMIAYRDATSSGYGKAVVASVSGTTISYGTAADFHANALSGAVSVTPLTSDKTIISWYGTGVTGTVATVASVSGTTITYGTPVQLISGSVNEIYGAQIGTDKTFFFYTVSGTAYARVASVSGTTITFGSQNTFTTADEISLAAIGTDKVILTHRFSSSTPYKRHATVATVSGTTITWSGQNVEYLSTTADSTSFTLAVKADTDSALLIGGYGGYSTGRVATVSTATITLGIDQPFSYAFNVDTFAAAKVDTDKIVVANNGSLMAGTFSGNSNVTFGEAVRYAGVCSGDLATKTYLNYVSPGKTLLIYLCPSGAFYGRTVSVSGTTITLGTPDAFASSASSNISVSEIGTNKFLVSEIYLSGVYYLKARTATVSGTSVSFGSPTQYSDNPYSVSIKSAPLGTDKALIYCYSASINVTRLVAASVSGTTVTFGTSSAGIASSVGPLAKVDTDKAVVYTYSGSNSYFRSVSVSGTNITLGNILAGTVPYYDVLTTIDTGNILWLSNNVSNNVKNLYSDGTTITTDSEALTSATTSNTYYYEAQLSQISDGKFVAMNSYYDTYGVSISIIRNTLAPTATTYVAATTDTNQLNSSYWTDINSGTVAETLNGQTINYAASFDDRITWKIYDDTLLNSGWRPIARNNSGTWEYNSNTSTGLSSVTWTSATTNTQAGALSQAMGVTANQLTGTAFNAIADSDWESSGGYASGSTQTLDFAVGMASTNGFTPALDSITINHEQSQYMLRVHDSNTVRFYNNSAASVSARITVATNATGAGNFWATATGGIHYVGSVGIGTTVPGALLDVNGTAWLRGSAGGTGGLFVAANGNVGIGKTNPTYNLDVAGSLGVGGTAYFASNVGIGTTSPLYKLDVLASGTGPIARFQNDNNTGCSVGGDGTITCTSDARLKKNIVDVEYGLADIMKLRSVEYNWQYESDGTQKKIGFIAQEVEGVLPQLVITDDKGMKQLNTIGLVPILAKAIQELASSANTQQANIITQEALDKEQEKMISTLHDKSVSVDDKIGLIGMALSDLNTETQKLISIQEEMDVRTQMVAALKQQMDLMQKQNQAIIDFTIALDFDRLIYKDEYGNVNITDGQLEADGMVAGVFTIKVKENQDPLYGTVIIEAGKNIVEVTNSNVKTTSLVNITLKSDPGTSVPYVSIQEDGKFTINTKDNVSSEVIINWWIMQTDNGQAP